MESERQTESGLTALVGRLVDGMGRLVGQHLALARLELVEDVQALGADLARLAVFLPFVLVGYLFLCAALAALLVPWAGWAGALALVGGANLVGGLAGVLHAAVRLKSRRLMEGTAAELDRSMTALAAVSAEPTALAQGEHHVS